MSMFCTIPLLLVGILAGDYASLDARPALHDGQRDVSDGTGHVVQWNAGTNADATAAAKVREMLAGELTVEQVARIALLNSTTRSPGNLSRISCVIVAPLAAKRLWSGEIAPTTRITSYTSRSNSCRQSA